MVTGDLSNTAATSQSIQELGPVTPEERKRIIEGSTVFGHYEKTVDRESAYEKLKGRTEEKNIPAREKTNATAASNSPAPSNPVSDILFGRTGPRGGKQSQGLFEAVSKSAARAIGSELGRQVIRGVLGSILGGKRR